MSVGHLENGGTGSDMFLEKLGELGVLIGNAQGDNLNYDLVLEDAHLGLINWTGFFSVLRNGVKNLQNAEYYQERFLGNVLDDIWDLLSKQIGREIGNTGLIFAREHAVAVLEYLIREERARQVIRLKVLNYLNNRLDELGVGPVHDSSLSTRYNEYEDLELYVGIESLQQEVFEAAFAVGLEQKYACVEDAVPSSLYLIKGMETHFVSSSEVAKFSYDFYIGLAKELYNGSYSLDRFRPKFEYIGEDGALILFEDLWDRDKCYVRIVVTDDVQVLAEEMKIFLLAADKFKKLDSTWKNRILRHLNFLVEQGLTSRQNFVASLARGIVYDREGNSEWTHQQLLALLEIIDEISGVAMADTYREYLESHLGIVLAESEAAIVVEEEPVELHQTRERIEGVNGHWEWIEEVDLDQSMAEAVMVRVWVWDE